MGKAYRALYKAKQNKRFSPSHSHSHSSAFTLLECLITLALTLILFSATLMTYHHFVNKNQLSVLVNQLTDALDFARDSAITTHQTMTLCAQETENSCGTNWEKGQLILDQQHKTVRILPAPPMNFNFDWRSTLGESDKLRWRSDGFTEGQQGSFFIRGQGQSAQIIVLRTGRWRVVWGV